MRFVALFIHSEAVAAKIRNEELEPFDVVFDRAIKDILRIYRYIEQQKLVDSMEAKIKLLELLLTRLLGIAPPSAS